MADLQEITQRKNLSAKKRELYQIQAREFDIREKLAQCELDIETFQQQLKQNEEIRLRVESELSALGQ